MAITYKIDVLEELKKKGFSTYRIREEKLFNQYTLQKFREGELVAWANIDRLCSILGCQPGDILQYKEG